MPDVDDEFERRFERDFRSYLSANLPESNPRWTAETAMSRERDRGSALLPLAGGVVAVGAVVVLAGVLVLRLPSTAQTSPSPDGTPEASIALASPTPAPTSATPPSPPPSTPVIQPVFVETNIVDRPRVPAELRDRYWFALGQVGEVGTTARIVLGPNELVIGYDAGLVASYAVIHNEEFGFDDPVVGPNGITVIVREVRTGAIRRIFDTPKVPELAVMAGERLFWFGRAPNEGADPDRDAIWGIDLANEDSVPVQITPPVKEQFGPSGARGPLYVSDGGRMVISTAGGADSNATQIIDVSTMSLRMTIDGAEGYALVGDRLLVHRAERRLGLFDVRTNRSVGPALDVFVAQKYLAGDGEFFVQYGIDGEGVYFAAIAADTGESRILLHQPTGVRTSFLNDMSTPDLLVLDSTDWEFDADGIPAARFSLLDPATGEFTEDAFVIGSP